MQRTKTDTGASDSDEADDSFWTGDASEKVEEAVKVEPTLAVLILKAGHHGERRVVRRRTKLCSAKTGRS